MPFLTVLSGRRGVVTTVLAGASLCAALVLPVLATSEKGPLVVTVSTSPNPYAIEGTTSVASSSGILAYATATKDVALQGYVTGQNAAGLEGFASSTTGTASNGVFGYSYNGSGVYGATNNEAYAAIYAANSDTTGGTAVYGTSSGDTFVAAATGGGGLALDATSAAQDIGTGAISGIDTDDVFGELFGVYGQANHGAGIEGVGSDTAGYGVYGSATGGYGAGVVAQGPASPNHAEPSAGLQVYSGGSDAIQVYSGASNVAQYNGNTQIMRVDSSGDLILTGTVTSAAVRAAYRGADGAQRVVYGSHATQSTIEDFGEATLVRGHAYVALDPALAGMLDRTKPYLVFVTPESDTAGVYVSSRTLSGFEIDEHGSAKALPVAYRIVGYPAARRGEARLAVLPAPEHYAGNRIPLRTSRHAHTLPRVAPMPPLIGPHIR